MGWEKSFGNLKWPPTFSESENILFFSPIVKLKLDLVRNMFILINILPFPQYKTTAFLTIIIDILAIEENTVKLLLPYLLHYTLFYYQKECNVHSLTTLMFGIYVLIYTHIFIK